MKNSGWKSQIHKTKFKRTELNVATENTKLLLEKKQSLFKPIFWLLILFSAFFLIFSSQRVGIPSDEPIDDTYGEKALNYYKSFGEDTSYTAINVFNIDYQFQKYYGSGFEMPLAWITSIFPESNRYNIRHVFVAICGLLIILYTGLLSNSLMGWLPACISIVLLLASPTLIGNALYNSKDIPFTLGFVVLVYYLIQVGKDYKSVKNVHLLGIIAGISISMSIRIGGLLTVFYFVIFWILKFALESDFRRSFLGISVNQKAKFLAVISISSFGGILLGLLFYPNFLEHPLKHIGEALATMSNFPVSIKMLFEGDIITSLTQPREYLVKSLLITLPLFILTAIPLNILFAKRIISVTGKVNYVFLTFICFFPVVFVLYKNTPVYNGWRHIMFFYPFLIVITSLTFSTILVQAKNNFPYRLLGGLLIVFVAKVLFWQAVNVPYNYVYYNELIGGFKGAYTYYDDDYQRLGTFEGVSWLTKNEIKKGDKKIRIASNNAHALKYFYDEEKLGIQFINSGFKNLRNVDWDYAVLSTVFLDSKLRQYAFPPIDQIYSVKVDGKGIAFVLKREDVNDLLGYRAIQQNNLDTALHLLGKAHKYNPKNFSNWLSLSYANLRLKNYDEAIKFSKKYLALFPSNWVANQVSGLVFLNQNKHTEAEHFLLKAVRSHPKNPVLYKNLIRLYSASGNMVKAQQCQLKLAKLYKTLEASKN